MARADVSGGSGHSLLRLSALPVTSACAPSPQRGRIRGMAYEPPSVWVEIIKTGDPLTVTKNVLHGDEACAHRSTRATALALEADGTAHSVGLSAPMLYAKARRLKPVKNCNCARGMSKAGPVPKEREFGRFAVGAPGTGKRR